MKSGPGAWVGRPICIPVGPSDANVAWASDGHTSHPLLCRRPPRGVPTPSMFNPLAMAASVSRADRSALCRCYPRARKPDWSHSVSGAVRFVWYLSAGGNVVKNASLLGLVVVALVVAACGDSGGSSEDSSEPTTSATQSDVPAADESTSTTKDFVEQAQEQLQDAVDTAGGTATVSIGEETWEFEFFESVPFAVCDADFFGGFFAVLTSQDDILVPNNSFNITLPGGDFTDPPSATLTIAVDGDAKWFADETIYERKEDLPPGLGVTSFSIDGNTASGTALFYEEESYFQLFNPEAELLMAEGTFEVTCASE